MTHDGGKKKVEFALSKTTENSVRRVLLASVVTFVFPPQLWIKPHLRLESNNKPQTDARVLQQQRPWPFFSAPPPHLPARLSVCLSESLLHLRDFSHTAARPCSLYRLCVFCSSTFGPGGKTFNQLIDLVNIYGSETEGETEVEEEEEEEPGGLITNLFDN